MNGESTSNAFLSSVTFSEAEEKKYGIKTEELFYVLVA